MRPMSSLRSSLSLALLALLTVACAAPPVRPAPAPPLPLHTATTPVPRTDVWWKERHVAINRMVRQQRPLLLFIGDSITQGWEGAGARVWEEYYGPRQAGNLGVSGDGTEHVLWRLEHGNLDALEPDLAVLMIGTNNSGRNTPAEIADGIEAIVRVLRERVPNTQVLLLAIFPRGATLDDSQRQVNEETNRRIARLGAEEGVVFVDLTAAFVDADGVVRGEWMPDLLHFNEAGYGAWAGALEPYLVEHLPQRRAD